MNKRGRVMVLVGVAVFLGSVGQMWFRWGTAGLLAAVAGSTVAGWVVELVASRASPSTATRAAVAAFVLITTAVAVFYPRLNHQSGTRGVDTDDDIRIATERALRLEYPFDGRTYLGNPTSHMPGSVLVAAPFVAAHAIQFQNVAFVGAGLVALWRRMASTRARVVILGGALASVGLWHQLVTGVSTVAEWIFITGVGIALVQARTRRSRLGLAAAFAVAITIRVNVLASAIAVLAALWCKESKRSAVEAGAVMGAVGAALVLPFVIGNRDRFQPFNVAGARFPYLDDLVPGGSTLLPVALVLVGVGASVVLARSARFDRVEAFLLSLVAIQLAQTGGLVILSLLASNVAEAKNWSDYLRVATIPLLVYGAHHVARTRTTDPATAREAE